MSSPGRRHSLPAPRPIPIPGNNREDADGGRGRRQSRQGEEMAATWGVSSTGHVYSDQLRSPSQPSNSLTQQHRSMSPDGLDQEESLAGPPSLNRHQSRSADAAPTLQHRPTSLQTYHLHRLQAQHADYKGSPRNDPGGGGGGSRSRASSLSKGSGRPPQHVSAACPPLYIVTNRLYIV